jgi:hypothetical protein
MMPKDERSRDEIMKTPQRNTLTDGDWDPHARLRDMDYDGVAGEVIFHGLNQGAGVYPLPWGDLICRPPASTPGRRTSWSAWVAISTTSGWPTSAPSNIWTSALYGT